MEGRWTRSAVLARDFDGALYIRQVHPGTGMVPDRAFAVLRVFGFFVDHLIATALVLFASLVWLVMGLVRFVRRAVHAESPEKRMNCPYCSQGISDENVVFRENLVWFVQDRRLQGAWNTRESSSQSRIEDRL